MRRISCPLTKANSLARIRRVLRSGAVSSSSSVKFGEGGFEWDGEGVWVWVWVWVWV